MSLFKEFMTKCTKIDKTTTSDGQGGFITEWTDGADFDAAIVKNSSMEAKIAEKQGVTEIFTVTVNKGLNLEYHDVFRRSSDGVVFRITSNAKDSTTPDVASFQFEQMSAERWDLT